MANKIDANSTGLTFAEEQSLKTLPGTPIWYPLEPNSYSDFGGQIKTVARSPINASRQRRKGVTTDLEAAGGFQQDLTFDNTTRLMQGFMFATAREKKTSAGLNNLTPATFSATNSGTKTYTGAVTALTGYLTNALVLMSGFTIAANNGLKTVASCTSTTVVITEAVTTDATAQPAAAKIETVGHLITTADANIAMNGSLVRLTTTTLNCTTLGLIPGEWIFVGGDAANTYFANNKGFARVSAIAAGYLEFDKVSWTPQAETGTGKTIQIFFGTIIKNENDPSLIVRRSYQLERQLGNDGSGIMSEYLVGSVPNELTINIAQADKVTADLTFVALDAEQRTGVTGVKAGTRPTLVATDAFNTSSDFSRIKLSLASTTNAATTPLFAFATEMKLSIKNNVSANKAIGVLGAFDTSAGTFEVGGNMTAYFASIDGVQAVRNNSDVTLDVVMVKNNKGLLYDIPLLSLGDGRLAVEKDQAITLPLEQMAAESQYGTTLLFESFAYLPTAADL